jgi:GNAT-family acetyltransferase (TIGR03103 family)
MARRTDQSHRLDRSASPSLRPGAGRGRPEFEQMRPNAWIHMGWGRLIFAHTFHSNRELADTICEEKPGERDIALYLQDPHVVLSLRPQELFLDPSHTYRLHLPEYQMVNKPYPGFRTRRIHTRKDAEGINRIYATWDMVTTDPDFMLDHRSTKLRTYLIAEHAETGDIIGTVTGVDHKAAFNDPENGSSLWCLAVDPQAALPGVGEALVRHLIGHYQARGRSYLDLSVMHDNEQAIGLYEKLGFRRVPVFCVKHKNPHNEPLFTPPRTETEEDLNPYAQIIVKEAQRRGIIVEVLDAEHGYFKLSFGGRSIVCRESLTELTTAIAMSRCDDKRVTRRLMEEAGLHVPEQAVAGDPDHNRAFLERHGRIVVKPARGEQGAGISVDVTDVQQMTEAIDEARRTCAEVILEQMAEGMDLRIIVIDHQVVAAATRRPPQVTGTGRHTVRELIEKYNRRRLAATGGESRVPFDGETQRALAAEGLGLDDKPEHGRLVTVRKTANLHTGGTIHDVTQELHPTLAEAAVRASRALDIPVVGMDLMVPAVDQAQYAIIEANERPGLANHEPAPTAERFIDLLFPRTARA